LEWFFIFCVFRILWKKKKTKNLQNSQQPKAQLKHNERISIGSIPPSSIAKAPGDGEGQ
jgi:hypothetical protein